MKNFEKILTVLSALSIILLMPTIILSWYYSPLIETLYGKIVLPIYALQLSFYIFYVLKIFYIKKNRLSL